MATRKGRAMLQSAVRQGCKIIVAQRGVQAALRAEWDGASTSLRKVEAEAIGVLILIFSACSLMLATAIPPIFEAILSATVHPLARVLLLGQAALLLGFWLRPTSSTEQDFFNGVRSLTTSLAVWSVMFAVAPELLASLAIKWWVRLLVVVVICFAAAAIVATFERKVGVPWVLALIGSILGPLITPLLVVCLTFYIGGSLLAVALVPTLEASATLPHGKHTEDAIERWYQRNSFRLVTPQLFKYFLTASASGNSIPKLESFLFPLTTILTTPKAKFFMASASRILLAVLLVAAPLDEAADEPSDGELTSRDLEAFDLRSLGGSKALTDDPLSLSSGLLFVWVVSAIVDEGIEFAVAPDMWLADDLNLLEMPGLVVAFVGTAYSVIPLPDVLVPTSSGTASVLACSVALLLTAQGLRLLQSSSELGPLVLMGVTMVKEDLVNWLMLTFIGVIVPFAASLYRIFGGTTETSLDGECAEMDATLADWRNVWVLTKVLVGGGGDTYVDCLEATQNSVAASIIFELYLLFTVVLLLNLLIALFSKTFDIIYEKQSMNYQFIFARNVMNAAERSMVPAPLNLLTLPHWLLSKAPALVARWCSGNCSWREYVKLAEDADDEDADDVDIDLTKHKAWSEANPLGHQARRRGSLTLEEDNTEASVEDNTEASVDDRERTVMLKQTLTEKVLEFLSDPANEEEREGLWRRQLRQSIGMMRTQVAEELRNRATQMNTAHAELTKQMRKITEEMGKIAKEASTAQVEQAEEMGKSHA